MTKDEEIVKLKAKIAELEKDIFTVPYPCPVCGDGMLWCSTIDGGHYIHNCGPKSVYTRIAKPLKEGQRSVLTNAIGGITE